MDRLVLVEPDCLAHDSLVTALKQQEFQVVCIQDAADAQEQIRSWQPSVILLRVPDTDDQLVRSLKKKADVPVIVPSASTEFGELLTALRQHPHGNRQ